jgi:tetratricopeptide (TPR) repeat protein
MNAGRLFSKLWLRAVAFGALLFGMKRRALEAYEAIVRIDPDDVIARATVGNMRMEQGDAAGAIDAFREIVARRPEHADTWFNLGFIHDQRDELAEAERCFRRAIELNAAHDRALYGLGLVLIRSGRLREAVDALRQNVKLQPFSPYGYYQLAMTLHHLGESGDAWRTYEQLKNFEPRYAATLKRDLEQTRSRASASPDATSDSIPAKEALTAST